MPKLSTGTSKLLVQSTWAYYLGVHDVHDVVAYTRAYCVRLLLPALDMTDKSIRVYLGVMPALKRHNAGPGCLLLSGAHPACFTPRLAHASTWV